MPEGDTIFRSARALHRALAGSVITRFDTAYAQLARVHDNTPIVGRTVERVEARGKWLLMYLSGDLILLTHMRMNGSWHMYRTGERWQRRSFDMRIRIETADWQVIGFTVPIAEFHTADSLARKTMVPQLGPDLLTQTFDPVAAIAKIQKHLEDEIAVVLLDQRVLAGIGNVFKSEVCFACGVHPFRLVRSLSDGEMDSLVRTSQKFLKANVADGSGDGIVTYSGMRRTTGSSDPSSRLWVYGRQGQPCRRCGGPIHSRKQGSQARTTFWCPVCQPMDSVSAPEPGSQVDGWSYRRTRNTGCK